MPRLRSATHCSHFLTAFGPVWHASFQKRTHVHRHKSIELSFVEMRRFPNREELQQSARQPSCIWDHLFHNINEIQFVVSSYDSDNHGSLLVIVKGVALASFESITLMFRKILQIFERTFKSRFALQALGCCWVLRTVIVGGSCSEIHSKSNNLDKHTCTHMQSPIWMLVSEMGYRVEPDYVMRDAPKASTFTYCYYATSSGKDSSRTTSLEVHP